MVKLEIPVYVGQARVGRQLGVGTPAVINWLKRFPGHCANHSKYRATCESCARAKAKSIPPPDAFVRMDTQKGEKLLPLWLPSSLESWDDWMAEKRWRLPD